MKSIIGITAIGLLFSIFYMIEYYSSGETIEVTVTDKEQVLDIGAGGDTITSKYLVFTETEVFENEDALFLGKWNSSDVQGKLKVGETYTVKVIGWRVPFLSMYRNIVKIIN
jgi:hypothetical protein